LQRNRTTQQKEPRQPTAFVQRWGRSNGKGNPRVGYVADRQDRRPNPDRGSPGRTNGNAVSIRESELDHRRPCAPSLPLHDPTTNQSALPAQRGIDKLRAECLTGDIRDLPPLYELQALEKSLSISRKRIPKRVPTNKCCCDTAIRPVSELSGLAAHIAKPTLMTDAVEKGLDLIVVSLDAAFDCRCCYAVSSGVEVDATTDAYATDATNAGFPSDGGPRILSASVLGFCTMAARWNSSRAPERPRSRMRSKPW